MSAARRMAVDRATKEALGPVPSHFPSLPWGARPAGSYVQQAATWKATPSAMKVEVDHMTPDSLHQAADQSRKGGDGASLSKRLPAAAMNKTQHRRKNTTGSGMVVEQQRAYLHHASYGHVPFAGPMNTPQDHYAAAVAVDIRSTATPSTLFGKPTVNDPREFHRPSHKGVVPQKDALWNMDRTQEMVGYIQQSGNIGADQYAYLQSVIEEQRQRIAAMYQGPAAKK